MVYPFKRQRFFNQVYITLLLFVNANVMSKNVKHSSEKTLRELMERFTNNNNNNNFVLGGCSKEVEKNIKELVGDKCESIMRQMQKAILSSSLHIARMFKLSA